MTPTLATDFHAVHALILRAFAGMEGRIDPPSSARDLTPESLAATRGEVWTLPSRGLLLACVILTPFPDHLYIGKLAVDPAHQRQGLARALISHAETRARALGLPELRLQTRVELTENHATFRALGFTETARTAHKGYDRPTSITFSKFIFS
ncbi:GNAT family N-acetyltransferase [Stagnihabitans tardus]|uniref:GNAT family N-acetyltransferase n=1 Tax=Stagnihabitans tardus TaxID=2699202 RepID=A0AAE5BS04_9RHOB|nr:GNAT family N-acetyltransferase [Stagnihabitans tardus]NBZ87215.1 GNAT family N-acetyltransferase [Stagnihabitans tardus]